MVWNYKKIDVKLPAKSFENYGELMKNKKEMRCECTKDMIWNYQQLNVKLRKKWFGILSKKWCEFADRTDVKLWKWYEITNKMMLNYKLRSY